MHNFVQLYIIEWVKHIIHLFLSTNMTIFIWLIILIWNVAFLWCFFLLPCLRLLWKSQLTQKKKSFGYGLSSSELNWSVVFKVDPHTGYVMSRRLEKRKDPQIDQSQLQKSFCYFWEWENSNANHTRYILKSQPNRMISTIIFFFLKKSMIFYLLKKKGVYL